MHLILTDSYIFVIFDYDLMERNRPQLKSHLLMLKGLRKFHKRKLSYKC